MLEFSNLSQAVDTLDEILFRGEPCSSADKARAAEFLLARQISSGAHAGLFAPAREELEAGVHLFTGERLHTHLGPRNVLSAEVGRLALLMGLPAPGMALALERLQAALLASCFAADLCTVGECAHSGVGLMRYLAAGGAADAESRLHAHLRLIAAHRDSTGRWKRFPFHYTLLVLSEIDLPAARAELRYAAPSLERPVRRSKGLDERLTRRREEVRERVLAVI